MIIQVVSLQSADKTATGYIQEIDDFVRRKMGVRLVKPLDLIVTARVKKSRSVVLGEKV